MATEDHDRDARIADAIRSMADDQGRLTSPPATLWGRIERAIDDPADADAGTGTGTGGSDLVAPPAELWDRIAEEVRSDGGTPVAPAERPHRRARVLTLVAAVVLVAGALVAVALVATRDSGGSAAELVARASLSGAGLDPGGNGSGSAELLEKNGNWKVAISVHDLPRPPAGSYYEAWLLGAGPGQVQSLGALEGTDRFAVPEGLPIDEFPLVDVSIEPIDGNPAHSSKSVLRGRLETS
jgi:hypothetical protein